MSFEDLVKKTRNQSTSRERGRILTPEDVIPTAVLREVYKVGQQQRTWIRNKLPVNLQRWVHKSLLVRLSVVGVAIREKQETVRAWQDADEYPEPEQIEKLARFFNVKTEVMEQALQECLLLRLEAMGYPRLETEPIDRSSLPPPDVIRKLFRPQRHVRHSEWVRIPRFSQGNVRRSVGPQPGGEPLASPPDPSDS